MEPTENRDDEYYQRLLENEGVHRKLVDKMVAVPLIDTLTKTNFFDSATLNDLEELKTPSMRNRIILSKVSQTGKVGFIQLKQALFKSNQKDVLQYLEESEALLDKQINSERSGHGTVYITTALDTTPTKENLRTFARAISTDWESLATHLALDRKSIERIKVDNISSPLDQAYFMLRTWKHRSDSNATLRFVLDILCKYNTSLIVNWSIIKEHFGFEYDASVDQLTESDIIEGTENKQATESSIGDTSGTVQVHTAMVPEHAITVDITKKVNMCRQLTKKLEATDGRLFDGQLMTLDEDEIRTWFNIPVNKGTPGTLYKTEGKLFGFNAVIMKEITRIRRSLINEKLSSRILHYAIVPLLALGESTVNMLQETRGHGEELLTCQFVVPYFENGSLYNAIQMDNNNATNKERLRLDGATRRRILYQVASAIDYLHTPVKGVRAAVIHTDVKSENILLDAHNNAKLIYYGHDRELIERYITCIECEKPAVINGHISTFYDIHRFGIVIQEMITGHNSQEIITLFRNEGCQMSITTVLYTRIPLQLSEDTHDLNMKVKETIRDLQGGERGLLLDQLSFKCIGFMEACLEDVKSPFKEMKLQETIQILENGDMCTECIEARVATVQLTSNAIKERLEGILRNKANNMWKRDTCKQPNMCELCMVNPSVDVPMVNHTDDCAYNVYVCGTCMRNSFLNPIRCHSCDSDIKPLIGGDTWGAICIAGNDKNGPVARTFKDDVQKLKQVFVSKWLPVTCIPKSNVEVVCPKEPGHDEKLKSQIKTAFDHLKRKKLSTVIVVYSGHHSKEKGFQLGIKGIDSDENTRTEASGEYMTNQEFSLLIKQLNDHNDSTESGEAQEEEQIQQTQNNEHIQTNSSKNTSNKSPLKVIVFLDCCYATSLDALQLTAPDICIMQINGCSFDETTLVSPGHFSIFSRSIIQAFTKQARGISCFNGSHCSLKECQIDGDFVTVEKLLTYVQTHITDYSEKKGHRRSRAMCAITHATPNDFLIAYNHSAKVVIQFSMFIGEEKVKRLIDVPSYVGDKRDLMEMLFAKYLDLSGVEGVDKQSSAKYANIMTVYSGPHTEHRKELDTSKKVISAWNTRRELIASPRTPTDINNGRVGMLLPNAPFIQECLTQSNIADIRGDVLKDPPHYTLFTITLENSRTVQQHLKEIEIKYTSDEILKSLKTFARVLETYSRVLEEIHNALAIPRCTGSKFIKIIFPSGKIGERFVCFELVGSESPSMRRGRLDEEE